MDTTIIIGPNGTGKTMFLKEIEFQRSEPVSYSYVGPTRIPGCFFESNYKKVADADETFPARFQKEASAFLPQIGTSISSLDYASLPNGTARALLLAVFVTAPKELVDDVLCLDCPEYGLHPAWQSKVARMIKTATFEECYIVTHSPDFLDAFTEEFLRGEVKILVFGERGERRELGEEHLKADLEKGWMLGDLYRVGTPLIGGWPS